jgi:hypothetical protein
MQKSLVDSYPKMVYKNTAPILPHIDEVLADVPCMGCADNLSDKPCDVIGCAKLTAWAAGGKI